MTDTRLVEVPDDDIRSVRVGDEVVVKCRPIHSPEPGWGKVVFEVVHLILLWRN